MKKPLILTSILASTIITISLATPYYLGIKTEENLKIQHQALKDTFFFDIISTDYQRGWFSSKETTIIRFHPNILSNLQDKLPDNLKTLLDKPVTMISDIKHGFFTTGFNRAQIHTEFQYDSSVQKTLARFFGDKTPISMDNTIYLNGNGQIVLNVAPFEYEELSGIKLDWAGMNSQIDYVDGYASYTSQFIMPKFKAILADKGELEFENASIKSQSQKGSNGIDLGNSKTKLGKFAVHWNESLGYNIRLNELVNAVTDLQISAFINPTGKIPPSQLSVKQLSYTTKTDEQNGFINSNGHFAFEELNYGEDKYGQLDIDVSAEHLDAKGLNDLKNRWKKIATEKHDTQINDELVLSSLRNEGASIFTNNPVFKINNFSLNTPSGSVKSKGQLSFKDLQKQDLNTLPSLVKKLDAQLDLEIAQGVIESFAMSQAKSLFTVDDKTNEHEQAEINETVRLMVRGTINSMADEGYLKKAGDVVQTQLKVADSVLTLNGKTLNQNEEDIYSLIESEEQNTTEKQGQ